MPDHDLAYISEQTDQVTARELQEESQTGRKILNISQCANQT